MHASQPFSGEALFGAREEGGALGLVGQHPEAGDARQHGRNALKEKEQLPAVQAKSALHLQHAIGNQTAWLDRKRGIKHQRIF